MPDSGVVVPLATSEGAIGLGWILRVGGFPQWYRGKEKGIDNGGSARLLKFVLVGFARKSIVVLVLREASPGARCASFT